MQKFTSFPKYSETNIFFGWRKYFSTTTSLKHLITSLNKQTESSVQVTLQNIKPLSRQRALVRHRNEIDRVCSLITPWALHRRNNQRESPGEEKSVCWLYRAPVSQAAGSSAEAQVMDTVHSSAQNTVLPLGLFQPRAGQLQSKQQEYL